MILRPDTSDTKTLIRTLRMLISEHNDFVDALDSYFYGDADISVVKSRIADIAKEIKDPNV